MDAYQSEDITPLSYCVADAQSVAAVDGQHAGITPCSLTIELGMATTRTVEVGLRLQDYKVALSKLQLERGKTTPVKITLERQTALVQPTIVAPTGPLHLQFLSPPALAAGGHELELDVSSPTHTIAGLVDDALGVWVNCMGMGKTELKLEHGGADNPGKRHFSYTLSTLRAGIDIPSLTFEANDTAGSSEALKVSVVRWVAQKEGFKINTKDGALMVWIPAGVFTMGSDAEGADEKTAHKVFLDGYWMCNNDITVAQYRKFCEATGARCRMRLIGGGLMTTRW